VSAGIVSCVWLVLTLSLLCSFQSQLLLLNQYTVSMYYSTPRSAVEMPEMWTRMDWSCAKVITHVAVCVYVNVYRCCGSELVDGLALGTWGNGGVLFLHICM